MATPTHSELAAKLIEGTLGAIGGTLRGQLPIVPSVLSDAQRQDLGIEPGEGETLFYQLSKSGVFVDVTGSRATIWFSGADSDRALGAVDSMLKRAYPKAKQAKDEADARDTALRVRTYDVTVGNGKMATVEVSYPAGKQSQKFVAQVIAMHVKN